MSDLRQSPQYARFMKAIGWKVKKTSNFYAYIKRFPIIGSFIKIQRPKKVDLKKVLDIAKKHRAFQIIIEPHSASPQGKENLLSKHGFRQSKSYFAPSKTIQIDLTKSQKNLFSEMHHKTRYNIRKATNNLQLTTYNSKGIKTFANFWQKCAKDQRGMFLSQKREITKMYEAFGKDAYIITINRDKELLSAVLLIKAGKMAYYMYAASNIKGKKNFAPTLNVWEVIKLAKKLGCKIFDFEGIYDERFPIESWQGFTRFKKSFGGKILKYPGTFTKSRIPI